MEVRRKRRKQGMDGGKEGGRKERDGDGGMRLKVYRNERKKGTRRESLARRGRLRVPQRALSRALVKSSWGRSVSNRKINMQATLRPLLSPGIGKRLAVLFTCGTSRGAPSVGCWPLVSSVARRWGVAEVLVGNFSRFGMIAASPRRRPRRLGPSASERERLEGSKAPRRSLRAITESWLGKVWVLEARAPGGPSFVFPPPGLSCLTDSEFVKT